ncbi:LysR family transcriptional regulator [Thetidibacter halocola]|uniref:LysR family transcriptional regulator n=1 Tax=Thetidibacter halocola TaxID=2827239 RepID=A0A8J7WKI9_9RHOB|nr:LysR family transcriptional regulator [Thetidibacter halocola]MBS0126718.1 LysR family transcriptional regulator [Thetidibacter halocola]
MSQINLDQLKAFLYVVRLGGVRKAAEGLHLTQPAVTARIKNLEQALGAELFDRDAGRMILTKRGEMLLGYAERFENLAGLVQRDIADPEGIEGRLRLGVSETIAQCWLPDLIYRLHGLYPKLEIEFNVDISINLRAALLDRALDLAVLLGPISEYSVNNVDLPGFDLAWYVSAKAPEPANPADYLRRPVLTYARQTRPFRELKESLFERVGPDVALFPSSSLSACFRLVEADLGVAALPRALGRDMVARGTIREFDPGWLPRPLLFTASYLGYPRSPMIETAATLAREVAVEFAMR